MSTPFESATQNGSTGRGPLERATDAVVDGLADQADEHVLRQEMDSVVEGLQAVLDGHAPAAPGPETPDQLRLLRTLRTEVLRGWSPEDGPLLPLMRAFDRYEDSLLSWAGRATVEDMLTPFSRKLLREVAHALRSPLGSMVALADGLRDEGAGPLTDLQKQQLGIIHRAALTAATMVGDVLTLVSDEERFETSSRFSLAETIETVADLMRPVTASRNSDLVVQPADGRYRTGPAFAVVQALLTLGLRAALMTRDGHVELRADEDGDGLVSFRVTTDGLDVSSEEDAEEQLRVLRNDPDADSFTMSTNGLAISAAKETLQRMGSELRLSPAPEGGLQMSFQLSLPPTG